MDVKKEASAAAVGVPDAQQLEKINALAKGTLTAEQVYVFSVRLCDDQVDRDFERFDTEALPVLAKLFVGKSGIVDHKWSAGGQLARIFDTEVVSGDGVTSIKAWAYIRRGGAGDEWIADIEAGIKKEVSVGCAMGSSVCSVCGGEYGSCGHRKGEYYDGALCCAILKEPMDAYEFSFVAVPAQPQAGVIKGMGMEKKTLKELVDQFGAQAEYRCLYKLAELGKQYTTDLQKRLKAHNSGKGAKYTRARLPVELVWWEECPTKQAAMSREWQVKHLSREEKLKLVETFKKEA
jgi:predicted GIY-YIG superfamily endonuclease